MSPKVSVVIPTYRRPVEYLSRAVHSVVNQTHGNREIIVVDDSPESYERRDEIKAFMQSIASDRIIYLQNERNLGGSLSRNRGIERASGEFISFLDDDDEYLPTKIERQLAFMVEHDFDLTFTDMVMYGDDGNVVDCRDYRDIPSFDNGVLRKYHLMKHLTGTPTFMFKADALRGIGGFEDVRMGQEFYLMLKAIERGLKIGYLPECGLKVYRHASGGISHGRNKIDGENNLYRFKKKYFPDLNRRERMFVRFRHYAVMVVAYCRNGSRFRAAGAAALAFAASPYDFFKEVSGFGVQVMRQRIRR